MEMLVYSLEHCDWFNKDGQYFRLPALTLPESLRLKQFYRMPSFYVQDTEIDTEKMIPVPNQPNQFYIISCIDIEDVPEEGTADYEEAIEDSSSFELELMHHFLTLKTKYKWVTLCQKMGVSTGELLNYHCLEMKEFCYDYGYSEKDNQLFPINTPIKSMDLETGAIQLIHEVDFDVYDKRFLVVGETS